MQNGYIIKEVPLNQIKPGRYQPRQQFDHEKLLDLATSIRDEGLLYPLLVFLDQDGKYELIGGERRWRASCAITLANIGDFNGELTDAVAITAASTWPEQINNGHYYHFQAYTVLVNEQPADISPEAQRVRAVADNLQRADLTPFEEAQAVYDLKTQLNLSIRQVAAKVGKSKSWVEDRLKLMKLDPAAAQAVAAAQTDESTPTLDMTVIREVARRLPEPLQKPMLDVLQEKAGKLPSDQIKKIVVDLARMADPANWSVPSDFDAPAHPRVFNSARAMIIIINSLPPATLVKRLMKLWGKESYNNTLAKNPANLVENDWDFGRIARTLFGQDSGSDDVWEQIAPAQGWTCANCLKGPLLGALENRVDEFDRPYEIPCKRLIDTNAGTCPQFVKAGDNADVPVITIPTNLKFCFEDGSHEAQMMKQLPGTNDNYVTTWLDYSHLYHAGRFALGEKQQREAAKAASAHLGQLQQYWQAQLSGDVDQYDFQAHACHKCKYFDKARLDEYGTGCKFAAKPLGKPDAPEAPEMGVLVDADGRAVPRCAKFRHAEMPDIQPVEGLAALDGQARQIVIRWYRALANAEKNNLIFGVLNWLPGGPPRGAFTHITGLDDAQLLRVLDIGVHEAMAARHSIYSNPVIRLIDHRGDPDEWKLLNWHQYIAQNTPYSWGDWGLPWAVRQADTKEKAA